MLLYDRALGHLLINTQGPVSGSRDKPISTQFHISDLLQDSVSVDEQPYTYSEIGNC